MNRVRAGRDLTPDSWPGGARVAVLLLTLVALSPLLRDDQPCTHAGGLHYYRIVAMRHMFGDGLLAGADQVRGIGLGGQRDMGPLAPTG